MDIAWHPAFISAIHLELADFREYLEFQTEYQLTTEPLKIDCVIIKKTKHIVIDKNFARFFRGRNIVEYKSPTAYLSVEDFYKVYAYACLYISLNEIPVTDITITLIRSGFSGKLIKHLRETRKYTVEKRDSGIYTVIGDIFPIQIIDNRKLSGDENIWLKIYFDAITRANSESFKEIRSMSEWYIVELLEEMGALDEMKAKDEAKGEKRREQEIAKRLLERGYPIDEIVSITDLEPEKVRELV